MAAFNWKFWQPRAALQPDDIFGHIPTVYPQIETSTTRVVQRQYANARSSRLYSGSRADTSADTEIVTSLTALRAVSRSLVRDTAYAKRAKAIVAMNVVGTGIGMQAQVKNSRDKLNPRINGEIEREWKAWSAADSCHTGGTLHFSDIEKLVIDEVFEAGDFFVRKHKRRLGRSKIPFALELIEPERLAGEYISNQLGAQQGVGVRMGVEIDDQHRPVAYWIRSHQPSEFQFASNALQFMERVPANEIIHVCVRDRFPQTRGVPWMHAAMRRMADMDGYSDAEITRARVQALTAGAIETAQTAQQFAGEEPQSDGEQQMELQPGTLLRLPPGEKLNVSPTNSPNPTFDPFMRSMTREIAASINVSYESLSRDYSQSNYSSSRLALLDDRDVWRFLQAWFIRSFRELIHREWLAMAVAAHAIPSISLAAYIDEPEKFEAVRFKPRGWSWVDPTKEVEAFKEAIKAGLTTRTDVIAATAAGRDIEDIDNERKQELDDAKEKGLVFDTDPGVFVEQKPEPRPPPKETEEEPDSPAARGVVRLRR